MKLYYAPGACSLAPHIVLNELGLHFQLEKVDLGSKKTQTGADYLAINGKGYVPALELDDGQVLTEGCVISEYLADQKPEAGLSFASGLERYQLASRMVFIATEIHKLMGSLFNPKLADATRESNSKLLGKRLNWLTENMGAEYVYGDHFTIADAYLFTVLNWAKIVKFDLSPWPALEAFIARIAARPAVQKTLQQEGLI